MIKQIIITALITFNSLAFSQQNKKNSYIYSFENFTIEFFLTNENIYSGYQVISDGIITAYYEGECNPQDIVNNKELLSLLAPISTEDNISTASVDYDNGSIFDATTNFPVSNAILNKNILSYEQTYTLINVPQYYNAPYGIVNNGCVPTSSTMLTSFLDRYCPSFSSCYSGLLPILHTDNKSLIDSKIVEMATLQGTTSTGTLIATMGLGLNTFLSDKNINVNGSDFNYKAYSVYSDFEYSLLNHKLPSICHKHVNGINYHTMLAFGIKKNTSGTFVAVKSTWKSQDESSTLYYNRTQLTGYGTIVDYNSFI